MCGQGCGGPSKDSLEFTRRWKPENNNGCGCSGSGRNDCSKPSIARVGSPLWQWEQIYGKLITKIIHTQDEDGHDIVTIEKTPCPLPETTRPSRNGCCSFVYRVKR